VSWAHPKFGSLLGSCGFDGRVIIWQEGYNRKWQAIYTSDDKLHTASVNSVAWAPEEVGLVLASASSDGSIGFLAYNNGKWESTKIASAHEMGALSVTWANPYPAGALFLGLWNSILPSYMYRLFICLCVARQEAWWPRTNGSNQRLRWLQPAAATTPSSSGGWKKVRLPGSRKLL